MTMRKQLDKLVRQFAEGLIQAVVETKDDVPTDDNQTISDIACGVLDDVNLDALVRAEVRRGLDAR